MLAFFGYNKNLNGFIFHKKMSNHSSLIFKIFCFFFKFITFLHLIRETFSSILIDIKLIDQGNPGKIINDSYITNLNYIVSIDNNSYNEANFTNLINPVGQNIIIEWSDSFPSCCEGMFDVEGKKIIKEIDLIDFSMPINNIISSKNMFLNQNFLEKINISNLETRNVVDMSGMFENCSSLEEVDFSNHDFSNVKNVENMFSHAKNLKTLIFPNVSIDDLNMDNMLGNCINLESIDLSNLEIRESIQLNNLFNNDISLIDIKMPKINVQHPLNFDYFFDSLNNSLKE